MMFCGFDLIWRLVGGSGPKVSERVSEFSLVLSLMLGAWPEIPPRTSGG